MTRSPRSVYVVVRLDFLGHDTGDDSIKEALENINCNINYDDDYLSLINSQIIDIIDYEEK